MYATNKSRRISQRSSVSIKIFQNTGNSDVSYWSHSQRRSVIGTKRLSEILPVVIILIHISPWIWMSCVRVRVYINVYIYLYIFIYVYKYIYMNICIYWWIWMSCVAKIRKSHVAHTKEAPCICIYSLICIVSYINICIYWWKWMRWVAYAYEKSRAI